MNPDFINLTTENLPHEHLCCIIRKKFHPGIDAKRRWLSDRLKEGHVFRKLNAKATVFIEYAPIARYCRAGKNTQKMRIEKITDNKKQFLDLLLLADEQENMIDKYLPGGDLFALYNDDLKSICVVIPIDNETCELKNIATYPKYQGKGYGKALISFISGFYRNTYQTMLVGTGETPTILSFYESCGFKKSHRVKNFFTDNYEQPIFEEGIQLVDMIYLKKELKE